MTSRYSNDRNDIFRRLTGYSARVLLGLGLAVVLSMVGLVIAWGLFVFSSSSDRVVFMVMNMVGAGIGASIGVNIAWIKLDRQQKAALLFTFLLCLAGGVVGGLLGYQYAANREYQCCAEPRTTPFIYAAFGAAIGANLLIYLSTLATPLIRAARRGKRPLPHRP